MIFFKSKRYFLVTGLITENTRDPRKYTCAEVYLHDSHVIMCQLPNELRSTWTYFLTSELTTECEHPKYGLTLTPKIDDLLISDNI